MKNNNGYISIEVIIVAGIVILIGIVTMIQFKDKASNITDKSLGKLDGISNDIN